LRVQALVWLAWLGVAAGATGATAAAPWRHATVGAMALSYVALVVLLRAWRRPADAATIARFAGIAATFAFAAPAQWWTWGLLLAFVVADLLDGWLARRFGGSPEGAVLDMETDQFTVLALALACRGEGIAAHVLVLPALRYAFVVLAWLLRIPAHDPKPVNGDNRRGRLVCACVFAALLTAAAPPVAPALGNGIVAVAVVLLAWSFAADARHLHRTLRARGRLA
jgi:phosphatidylglycerophosphate synthase